VQHFNIAFSVGNYIALLSSENQTLNLMLYHFAKY